MLPTQAAATCAWLSCCTHFVAFALQLGSSSLKVMSCVLHSASSVSLSHLHADGSMFVSASLPIE